MGAAATERWFPIDDSRRGATPPANEIVRFATADEFETWLTINHEIHGGIWIAIAKKAAPQRSIAYDEAVDLALCYGWIDGQKASSDEHHWLQRFTRRTRQADGHRSIERRPSASLRKNGCEPPGMPRFNAHRPMVDGTRPTPAKAAQPSLATYSASLTATRRIAKYLDMIRRGERIH